MAGISPGVANHNVFPASLPQDRISCYAGLAHKQAPQERQGNSSKIGTRTRYKSASWYEMKSSL